FVGTAKLPRTPASSLFTMSKQGLVGVGGVRSKNVAWHCIDMRHSCVVELTRSGESTGVRIAAERPALRRAADGGARRRRIARVNLDEGRPGAHGVAANFEEAISANKKSRRRVRCDAGQSDRRALADYTVSGELAGPTAAHREAANVEPGSRNRDAIVRRADEVLLKLLLL